MFIKKPKVVSMITMTIEFPAHSWNKAYCAGTKSEIKMRWYAERITMTSLKPWRALSEGKKKGLVFMNAIIIKVDIKMIKPI